MSKRRTTRRHLVALAAVIAVAAGGCTSMKIYDACRKKSQGLGDMDACMNGHGYAFVNENAAIDPAMGECWDDRYAGKMPMEYCWVQVGPPMPPVYGP